MQLRVSLARIFQTEKVRKSAETPGTGPYPGSLGAAGKSACATLLGLAAFVFGIEFAADEGDGGHEVHPDEEGDAGTDGAVHDVIARDVRTME